MANSGEHLKQNGSHPDSQIHDDAACRIYLVRHGRTVMNVEKRFRGTLEVPLDEHGKQDAWRAAHSLAGESIRAVYTSPLGRARDVARAIAEVAGVRHVQDLPGLLNLDYGEWHGLTKEECKRRDPAAWRLYKEAPEEAVCPGGEALATAADRVVGALRAIADCHPGQAVAAVSHGVMVRLAVLRAAPQPDGWEIPLETGSATVFNVDGRIALVRLPEAVDDAKARREDAPFAAQVAFGQA